MFAVGKIINRKIYKNNKHFLGGKCKTLNTGRMKKFTIIALAILSFGMNGVFTGINSI